MLRMFWMQRNIWYDAWLQQLLTWWSWVLPILPPHPTRVCQTKTNHSGHTYPVSCKLRPYVISSPPPKPPRWFYWCQKDIDVCIWSIKCESPSGSNVLIYKQRRKGGGHMWKRSMSKCLSLYYCFYIGTFLRVQKHNVRSEQSRVRGKTIQRWVFFPNRVCDVHLDFNAKVCRKERENTFN